MEETQNGARSFTLEVRSPGSVQPHPLLPVTLSKDHPLPSPLIKLVFLQLRLSPAFPDFCHVHRSLYCYLCIIFLKCGSYFC